MEKNIFGVTQKINLGKSGMLERQNGQKVSSADGQMENFLD
jgi:hypothetical protein